MRALTNDTDIIKQLVEQNDYKTIYKLAKNLDEKGIVDGTLMLSVMYHNGDYVKQNYKREVKLLRKATKMGSLQAKFNLAMAFATGSGIKQNIDKAISMMEQLADDGFEPAIDFLYGDECDCCNGGCGACNLVKCGETLDVVMARLIALMEKKDFKTAFELATELDEIDIENGTYALSTFYHNGQHVKQNFVKEVELLEKAASKGFEPALYNLAVAISLGKGIEQNAELGYEIVCDLAEDGYEPAVELLDGMAA
ncbi:hypothetical protein GJV85_03470 [Sulfurimonas aquatica]|uniref:beta-lactamase n=1 Tax=Sulfurimonas aquatica TaxID=2672570 RepID=A0A975AZ16_9BACT|nr:tetratricopeptide repeat protein [Sulfurimonas aquatica]QSZ41209.1 hypothetical protein GJV85_03470 [Sulfurimonas aquatica]